MWSWEGKSGTFAAVWLQVWLMPFTSQKGQQCEGTQGLQCWALRVSGPQAKVAVRLAGCIRPPILLSILVSYNQEKGASQTH